MHYYIGLDNGGTTTKAALFSSTGEEIAVWQHVHRHADAAAGLC